jgi:hypothetical protein
MTPVSIAHPSAAAERPARILLLGIGKSGTTALMTALSQSLALPYVMEPKNLNNLDYGSSFIVKKLVDTFSEPEIDCLPNFDRIVFVVRDPRDALVSRILYQPYKLPAFADDGAVRRYISILERKIEAPDSVPLIGIINELREISGYRTLKTVTIIQNKFMHIYNLFQHNALLIHYEDFIDGKIGALESYVGSNIIGSVQVEDKFQRVVRSRGYGDWKNWFTSKDKKFLDDKFKDFYIKFGYAPEETKSAPTIDRDLSINYIVKVINEGRERRGIPAYTPDR